MTTHKSLIVHVRVWLMITASYSLQPFEIHQVHDGRGDLWTNGADPLLMDLRTSELLCRLDATGVSSQRSMNQMKRNFLTKHTFFLLLSMQTLQKNCKQKFNLRT